MNSKFEKITENELNQNLRDKMDSIDNHIADNNIHVSSTDRIKWDTGSSIGNATSEKAGLFSADDKLKLDKIEASANNYTHPVFNSSGSYIQVDVDPNGHVIKGSNPDHLNITVTNSDQLGGRPAAGYATLLNPNFSGVVNAPTQSVSTSNNSVATTQFVHNVLTATGAGYIHPLSGITTELLPAGTDIVLKNSVASVAAISTTYPNPVEKWLVPVVPDSTNPSNCTYYLYKNSSWNLVDINDLWTKSFLITTVNKYGHVVEGSNPTSLDITVTNSNKLGGIDSSSFAKLDSPSFVGTPILATSLDINDSSNKLATTAFTHSLVNSIGNLPIGFEFLQINPNTPSGCLPFRGVSTTYNREEYKLLWNWLLTQGSYLISDALWWEKFNANDGNVPYYSTGDGSTSFRVPNINAYVRGSGYTSKTAYDSPGTYYRDGIPQLTGTFGVDDQTASQLSGVIKQDGFFTYDARSVLDEGDGRIIRFDSSLAIRVAPEVMPKTIVGTWFVKAKF